MTERWYYARDQRRQGPVPRERLIDLFRNGWLSPDDLVWSEGMADWMPARSFDWLCGATLTRTLRDLVKATLHPGRRRPPPAGHPLPAPQALGEPPPLVDWDRLETRHLVATAGAFLTALGIAFTVIARTRFALAVTLLGLALLALGRARESRWLLRQAWGNLVQTRRELERRRAETRRHATERDRAAAELAAAARPATAPPTPPRDEPAAAAEMPPVPAAVPTVPHRHRPTPRGETRRIVYEPPVRRFRPWVAACLSLFIPGLGQLYKRQILNAIAWFALVATGYAALVVPGVILHLCCILGASSGDPWTKGRTVWVDDRADAPRG